MVKKIKKLRVGVVGTGHLGAFHARVYSTLAQRRKELVLSCVCDVREDMAKTIAEQYGTAYYTDYRSMINSVDAVSIVVPTSKHYEVAKEFIKAGKHVLIEKPITKKLNEADELIALAEKKGVIIQVGHIERFNSAVRAIEPYLRKPTFIECNRLGSIKAKQRIKDVGVVLDLMIHDIDIILSLVNSPVKHIEAFGQSTVSKHEDMANVRLTFKNDIIADITASRITKEEIRSIRIFQENSYIFLDYKKCEAFIFRKTPHGLKKTKININKKDALSVELSAFINCILKGKRPLVSGIEGRQALKVGLDILEQIKNNS
ncbi:MAG TPA: Gfo/Idh/MocA family oxidoreductase [Candidatus Omnitrophota bacterium]|nr:Gfo/Idh/MocA family oxidoreductase [Candidatus Omnitrophota bacterium]HPS20676.1 Gfo/Idh/MocA family oxidoreductase [Candidatus Omnitrophota bacterium]